MIKTIVSINPSTKEVNGKIQASSSSQIKKAVERARKNLESWQGTPVEKRIELIRKLSKLLEEEKATIIALIMNEIGKPRIEAETEVLDSQAAIAYYCDKIKEIHDKNIEMDKEFFPNTEATVKFIPHGVIGLITPWNYPFITPIWTIIPALLTGNTIVFKPSENSLLTGKKIDELINKVFAKGIFNTIYGDKEEGKLLVKSDIDKLFFTGSVEAGQHIMKNIGIKPTALELGGKDSAIVCEDADLELTVKGVVWGGINNCGQVCTSIEKVYVHEKIADKFIQKVVEEVRKLRVRTDFGPLVSKEQLSKVDAHVKEAVSKGAKVFVGGKKINRKGFFFEPTVLVNLKENMKIVSEETFGPIIPIFIVKNDDEAIKLTNDSKYGLGVTVWTKNIDKGKMTTDKINTGLVWINDVNLPLPGGDYWGGVKLSGLRCSENKLRQCLKAKTSLTYSGKEKRSWWYPYN